MIFKLDLKNINCPLPVLKTKKFLATINSGDVVEIETTDPSSKQDLIEFCQKSGNMMIKQSETIDNVIITTIRRK